MVLLAESTLQESFDQQWNYSHSVNVLANNRLIGKLRETNPGGFQKLVEKLDAKHAALLGGLDRPIDGNYETYDDMFRCFEEGRRTIKELGISQPEVFAQFEPGIGFLTPDLLAEFGYRGAIVNAWSGGSIPDKDSAKVRWQSHSEGSAIDAIIGYVIDAASEEAFLHFSVNLSKQLDYHQVPTLVLAHWPNRYGNTMRDLLRIIARSPALGTFETANKYFDTTNQPYSTDSFKNHQFKVPIPGSEKERNDLANRLAMYTKESVVCSRIRSTAGLWRQVANEAKKGNFEAILNDDALTSGWSHSAGSQSNALSNLTHAKNRLLHEIAQLSKLEVDASRPINGLLVVNPASHPRRVYLEDLPATIDATSSTRIFGLSSHDGFSSCVVDIPPFGFVKLRANDYRADKAQPKPTVTTGFLKQIFGSRQQIADRNWTLVNEFMELQIDPKRGHLRSLFVPGLRGSRMSGMASLVEGAPRREPKMARERFFALRRHHT